MTWRVRLRVVGEGEGVKGCIEGWRKDGVKVKTAWRHKKKDIR